MLGLVRCEPPVGETSPWICRLVSLHQFFIQNIANPFSSFTPEMEFSDINLTKDSSLLLRAIHKSPSTVLADFKDRHSLSWV